MTAQVLAQASEGLGPVTWTLWVDGQEEGFVPETPFPVEHLDHVAREAVALLQADGYPLARVDSARVDTGRTPGPQAAFGTSTFTEPRMRRVTLYATRGPEARVAEVRIEGAVALDSLALGALMGTRVGAPLRPAQLRADLERMLAAYDEAGYPLAQIDVEQDFDTSTDPLGLRVRLRVQEGGSLPLVRLEVPGAERTRPAFVERVTALQVGRPLRGFDPAEVQRRMEETGLFDQVDRPELALDADGQAVVRIPVQEAAPGTFDVVLGYLPEGGLVGNGHLVLRHLFGAGREVALKLDRRPGLASRAEVRAADPYVAGTALGVAVGFRGEQRDSTFGQQALRGEVSWRLSADLQLFGSVSRERTRPGEGGQQLVGGVQQVPRADAWFTGLGLRFERVDRRLNPRRGQTLEVHVETGRTSRSARGALPGVEGIPADSQAAVQQVIRQERVRVHLRSYVPLFRRQVAVVGGDASLLRSDQFVLSDLFQLGGTASLRGYDEDRFEGRLVARLLGEYRYQLDPTSYALAFVDVGYVDRPVLQDGRATRSWHPGYGIGLVVDTPLGAVNVSYALSPEDRLSNGRVHVGLSVGL
ncbi:MAG: BamA/TamA family outer membrane protein [Bacteroidota bacterium]